MGETKPKLVLGTFSTPMFKVQTLMLVRSLRQFGGAMADLPVWVFTPEGMDFKAGTRAVLDGLGVACRSFAINETLLRFPFAAKAIASAAAEELALHEGVDLLAWHDRTGVIRHAPSAFNLPEDKSFGFRPTDIANIGASFGDPLPPFWVDICNHFGLSADDLPPITSAIDQKQLHLYVNAGLLVVRPEKGIFSAWTENLQETYALPKFKAYYQEKQAYAIFMHQAALTAAVVQKTTADERLILPDTYLFSVDNFFDYPKSLRPATLDEVVTGRFHDFFGLADWEKLISAGDDLVDWFKAQLREGDYWPES
jgi:hypothetical protein